jgi:hypothetical protein
MGAVPRLSLLALVATAAGLLCSVPPAGAAGTRGVDAAVYAGVGSWVDIFATSARRDPDAVVRSLHARGVHTLYLETSNDSQSQPIVHPSVVGRFLDDAHAAGIGVVAWYLPGFTSPARDLARALAAIRYRSPGGQRFDSFALDIESSTVRSVPLRNERLLSLSRELRHAVGASYPLGAIIPSPVGMWLHPKYWPGFPYQQLGAIYDAFVPMAYFSYHTKTETGAYTYTRNVIDAIRVESGRQDVPIQLIGGIADAISRTALDGFARAAADCGVDGISLYAYLETSASEWQRLAAVPLGVRRPAATQC